MKSVRLVQNFCPAKETNRTHSKGYVEDLLTQAGRKGCAKMIGLNLSVLPQHPQGYFLSFEVVFHNAPSTSPTLPNTIYDTTFSNLVNKEKRNFLQKTLKTCHL